MPKATNKEKVLAALLEQPTVTAAAQACGLSHATVYRFLQDPGFKREYRSARAAIVETAVSRLQSLTGAAIDTLERNLNCDNKAVEVRTAQIILENAVAGIGLGDLLERVEALEHDDKESIY